MAEVRFLSAEAIGGLTTAGEHVDAVRDGYCERGNGAPTKPRTSLRNDQPAGLLNSYTAILPEAGMMGGYMYSAGFESEDAWLLTPLFDAQTGRPLAVLDGAAINTYKTGAVGAVGIDALAREDAQVLSVFGSGAQARGQVRGAVTVRDFEQLLVYSPTPDHRESFAAEMGEAFDLEARAVSSPERAVTPADVIITATNASVPVFDGTDLQPGTHVTAIGQYDPTKRELDAETVRQATYVVDLRERADQDAGSLLGAIERGAIDHTHIHGELGAVLTGTVPGRTSETEITVFDSGGTAIETVASAGLAYRKAVDQDLGSPFPLKPASEVYEGKQGSTTDELE